MAQMDNNSGGYVGNGRGYRPPAQRQSPSPAPGKMPGKPDNFNNSVNRQNKAPNGRPIRVFPLSPEPTYDPKDKGGPFGDRSDTN
jgi:hypothetical protein